MEIMEVSHTYTISVSLAILILSTMLKLLLMPSYTSTDFEVHRNWLAITHSLPHHLWYFEDTSEWTLDYPPLFAWFEWLLSQIAVYFDENIVNISNLNHKSAATVYFQRGSVIICDFVLLYATYKCAKFLHPTVKSKVKRNAGNEYDVQIIFFALISFSCGLLIVDHIHFQYNGFLFGVLFLSFANMMQGNFVWASLWFAILINLKHIFLYIAPVYGIYLLRCYCMDRCKAGLDALKSFRFSRLFALGTVVLGIFAITYGPFIEHIAQVASRLFPFKRGLTHAYWAPNFWALYNFADKVLHHVNTKYGFQNITNPGSSTSGLVQNIEHSVLPSVPPVATFVLTLISIVPCLVKMWVSPCKSNSNSFNQFLRSLVLCSLSSFMLGWHVHEKAILMALLPLTLLAVNGSKDDAAVFLILQACGHYSLFPLLFTYFETVTKICLFSVYIIFSFLSVGYIHNHQFGLKSNLPLLNYVESIYVYGLILVELFCAVAVTISKLKRFAYLPLMVTSVYCAVGVTYSWVLLYKQFMFDAVTELQPRTHAKKMK